MVNKYKESIEAMLAKPNGIHKKGTFNKQEPTINIGDPETNGIVAFENNLLYDKYHFISNY